MKRTDQTNEPSVRKDYDKKILSVVHHLHPYVKQRLHVAESVGILPKNLYASNGIIDDSIIKLYEKGNDRDADVNCIKLKLFETIDDYLEDLFVKEAYHKKTISTSTLLQEELHRLEESFTIDADEDYMMLEELDDISYHQHDDEYEVFVFDDHNSKILNVLDRSEERRVGKECRSRWSADRGKKRTTEHVESQYVCKISTRQLCKGET